MADGVAVDPSQLGHVPACPGWAAGQALKPLEPWGLAALTVGLQARLQRLSLVRHNRKGLAHRRLSSGRELSTPPMSTDLCTMPNPNASNISWR